MKNAIICPVCGEGLTFTEKTAVCPNRHSFDRAKEGSVNLILNGSPTSGDDPKMVSARKNFLGGGYYGHLSEALKEELEVYIKNGSTVLDACCGEGYFTNELSKAYPEADFYGFDLSKRAVRYAARDSENAIFFAANISSIPFADKSADVLTHIFAPVCDAEFSRILKDDGIFVHVFPGKDHLMGIKELLYEKTRENDEDAGVSEIFELVSSKKIRKDICLDNAALVDLLTMTPYFYRTPKDRLEDVMKKDSASTPAEFIINIYKKRV